MNMEHDNPKAGLIGELLVKIRLNQLGANTGSVDVDTGTDIVMFYNNVIRTGQVKTSIRNAPENGCRNVDVLFRVYLVSCDKQFLLDESRIEWRFRNSSEFRSLTDDSLVEMFS